MPNEKGEKKEEQESNSLEPPAAAAAAVTAMEPNAVVNRGVIQPPTCQQHTALKQKDEELAVARPVYGREERAAAAELVDEENAPFYKQTIFSCLLFISVVVVALAVGVSLGATKPWQDDIITNKNEEPGPTGSPTLAPTLMGPLLLKEELSTLFTPDLVKSSQESFDSAAEWFYYDELKFRNSTGDDPDDDDEVAARRKYRLFADEYQEYKLQRFVLAWFWHHTTDNGRKPWFSCNKPVGDEKDECDKLEVTVIRIINDEPVLCYAPVPALRWLSSTDECEWVGIRCYRNGDVAVIELYGVGVTGKFPEFLHVLERLQVIRLSYGGLSGTFPNNMDKLTGLRELSLIGNMLEGPIPENFYKMDLRNMNGKCRLEFPPSNSNFIHHLSHSYSMQLPSINSEALYLQKSEAFPH